MERARRLLRHWVEQQLRPSPRRDDQSDSRVQPRHGLHGDHGRRVRAQGDLALRIRRRLPVRRSGVRQDVPALAQRLRRLRPDRVRHRVQHLRADLDDVRRPGERCEHGALLRDLGLREHPALEIRKITYNGADRAGYPRPEGRDPDVRVARGRLRLVRLIEPPARAAARIRLLRAAVPVVASPDSRDPGRGRRRRQHGRLGAAHRASRYSRRGGRCRRPDQGVDHRRAREARTRRLHRRGPVAPAAAADRQGQRRPGGVRAGHARRPSISNPPCPAHDPDTAIGSACSITTSADAITPGVVAEGKRAMWQLGQVQVLDGGAGRRGVVGEQLAVPDQGVFVP